ncbi:hypothetical protein VTI74DRAFT_8478 [Chaetomium olivicolor]
MSHSESKKTEVRTRRNNADEALLSSGVGQGVLVSAVLCVVRGKRMANIEAWRASDGCLCARTSSQMAGQSASARFSRSDGADIGELAGRVASTTKSMVALLTQAGNTAERTWRGIEESLAPWQRKRRLPTAYATDCPVSSTARSRTIVNCGIAGLDCGRSSEAWVVLGRHWWTCRALLEPK